MDPLEKILRNAREKLGCNGLRNMTDLAQMRQETLEKRLISAGRRLSCKNMASIYSAWLSERICLKPSEETRGIVERMCLLLWRAGCEMKLALDVWMDCAEVQARMPWQTPTVRAALHGIGELIFTVFQNGAKGVADPGLLKEVASVERLSSPKYRSRSRSPRKNVRDFRSRGDSQRRRALPPPSASRVEAGPASNRSKPSMPLRTETNEPWKAYFYDVVKERRQNGDKVTAEENNDWNLSGLPFMGNSRPQQDLSAPEYTASSSKEKQKVVPKVTEQMSSIQKTAIAPSLYNEPQPNNLLRPMWTNFGEASTFTASPFTAVTSKNVGRSQLFKPVAETRFQAPVAAMEPDLINGVANFGATWPSSSKRLNDGRLSPWEEDNPDAEEPLQRVTSTKSSSSAVARQFLESLERVTSLGTSPSRNVGDMNNANSMHHMPNSYMGAWVDETQSSTSSTSSFPSTPMSEGSYTMGRPTYYQAQDIELMSTQKPLVGYDPAVERLFRSRDNVWVHHMKRKVALDFWEGNASAQFQEFQECGAPNNKGWGAGSPSPRTDTGSNAEY
ncbi:hypothetical protein K4F52_009429 [Lecanicillium sp. MT-2017a]|nr:hypothetical protein K4F52_009429 [Lecanicillium sp. MT-2017a]